jgi:hypothetical protein
LQHQHNQLLKQLLHKLQLKKRNEDSLEDLKICLVSEASQINQKLKHKLQEVLLVIL